MIPDYCEPLTAYRVWNVAPNGLLVGQAHSEPWPPYEAFVGRCGYVASKKGAQAHVQDGHWIGAPVLACDCGIHAFKDEAVARERWTANVASAWWSFYFSSGNTYRPEGRVWGAIKIWGRVIEHELGYRAEFAYPSALHCHEAKLAAKISALYGVPCEVVETPVAARPEKDDALRYYSIASSWMSSPLTYAPSVFTPSQPAPTTGPVQTASLSAVKALSASRWQKHQTKPAPQQDWRAIMRHAVFAMKDDIGADALTIPAQVMA